jgi:hypothetical protein
MITIFARPSYVGNRFPHHTQDSATQRVSSRIRGEEIAEYLGCKLNPRDDYENDVCVWVKPAGLDKVRDNDWVDFLDDEPLLPYIYKRPKVKLIAASQRSYLELKKHFPNEMVLIPQQHINWDRQRRTRTEIKIAGYIGSPSPYAFKHYAQIGEELKKVGLEFKTCFDFQTKQDAINFYLSIDVLVIGAWELGDPSPYKIPTKIINAMSFGVPSIAYPLESYNEINGFYLEANNMTELLTQAKRVQNTLFYMKEVNLIVHKSDKYHISRIAGMYEELR